MEARGPRVDFAGTDQIDQFRQEATYRCRAAVKMDLGEEQLIAWELDAVGDADIAAVPTGTGGADGLHHRLLGTDGLDHRVRAELAGELLDPCDAVVAAFGGVVGASITPRWRTITLTASSTIFLATLSAATAAWIPASWEATSSSTNHSP